MNAYNEILYFHQCLQKTAPPVIIFCERKSDVDEIHEYLLLKGVEAVSIHGGKDQVFIFFHIYNKYLYQEERNEAIRLYKEGRKDVLVNLFVNISTIVYILYVYQFRSQQILQRKVWTSPTSK